MCSLLWVARHGLPAVPSSSIPWRERRYDDTVRQGRRRQGRLRTDGIFHRPRDRWKRYPARFRHEGVVVTHHNKNRSHNSMPTKDDHVSNRRTQLQTTLRSRIRIRIAAKEEERKIKGLFVNFQPRSVLSTF